MNVCLIGDGLISLTLAKTLINNKIKVFVYSKNNKKIINKNRTIGITSNNLDFFQKEIIKINKDLIWEITQIEIYNNQNKEQKILNFQKSKKPLFSIIKNNDLYDLLNKSLEQSGYTLPTFESLYDSNIEIISVILRFWGTFEGQRFCKDIF